jgi:arsenate reductase
MKPLFVYYPKCSTCQKAKKWLDENSIFYEERHIVENNPTFQELAKWHLLSGLPLKKFFNTSGKIYKEKKLKFILPDLTNEEMLNTLSSNGMLVKRPLLVLENYVLVGFKEDEWKSNLT